MLEPERSCPYPRCEGAPEPRDLRCPACRRKLLPCRVCGAANRATATYCRHCGGSLTPEDEWRLPRGSAGQTGYLPSQVRMAPLGQPANHLRRRSLRLAVDAPPVAAYDYLFVPTAAHGLHVLTVDTLESVAVLESPFGAPLLQPPAVVGGCVYVVSPRGLAVFDLARTLSGPTMAPTLIGSPIQVKDHIITPPMVFGDMVYFGTEQGLCRVDPRGSGTPQVLASGRSYLLARHGETLVFCPEEQAIEGVDPASGVSRWRRAPKRWQADGLRVRPQAGLMSDGTTLHFADQDGTIWMLYPETGDALPMVHRPEGVTGLALMPDGGCVVGSIGGLFAYDSAGTRRWAIEHEELECPPVVTRHLVLAGTTGGGLLLADRLKGSLDKQAVGSGAVRGIALSGASVLAVTGEGDVTAFDLPLEEEVATRA